MLFDNRLLSIFYRIEMKSDRFRYICLSGNYLSRFYQLSNGKGAAVSTDGDHTSTENAKMT